MAFLSQVTSVSGFLKLEWTWDGCTPRVNNPLALPFRQGVVGGPSVSIVRVGLSETKHFADGYDAIFGKKESKPGEAKAAVKSNTARKKKKAKKK
jgi:hypothetical protein